MDHAQFETLTRRFADQVTRRHSLGLLGALGVAGATLTEDAAAKKKKKKCAKKCPNGCCTGTRGKCIQPANQSATQCGVGGAICQSIGCPACSPSRPCPTGQCCRGDGTCGSCLVFVTSSLQASNLGGLAGADAICQNRASAAGLPGTYLAWLSNASASPSTRFTQATVPYVLVNGSTVADNWSDLTSGSLNHAINITETGGDSTGPNISVWTNTLITGAASSVASSGSCDNWTSASNAIAGWVGDSTSTVGGWTNHSSRPCDPQRRLYCFQQR